MKNFILTTVLGLKRVMTVSYLFSPVFGKFLSAVEILLNRK